MQITMWWEQKLRYEPIWQTKQILQVQAFYNENHHENELITRLLPMNIIDIDWYCVIPKYDLIDEHFDSFLEKWSGIDHAHWMSSVRDSGVPYWYAKDLLNFQDEFSENLNNYCEMKNEDFSELQYSNPNYALEIAYIVVWKIYCRYQL